MARRHGKSGRVYLGLTTSGAAAEPVAFLKSWEINFATDKDDVTAFGDGNKVYVAGLPDANGTFDGYYDDATVQTYSAAIDGLPRNFYLYPNTNNTAQYWFGQVLPDFSTSADVGGAIQIKSSWSAASLIQKVG